MRHPNLICCAKYIIALCLAVGLLAGGAHRPSADEIDFLSVGQGDCAVLRTGDTAVLVDVGPASPTFDAGERIVVPRLRALGIDAVDIVFLTHPDEDHVGGLHAVLSAFPRAKVAVSDQFRGFAPMELRLAQGGVDDSKVIWLGPDTSVKFGDFRLQVESPPWHAGEPDNDGSLFILAKDLGSSAVLTGDASSMAEAEEAPRLAWHADILKAGHHGSKSATSEMWVEAVKPKFAVISCGLHNRYGHPSPEVVQRLAADHVETHRTDLEGDLRFEATVHGFELEK